MEDPVEYDTSSSGTSVISEALVGSHVFDVLGDESCIVISLGVGGRR